jgi:hypothetical protein
VRLRAAPLRGRASLARSHAPLARARARRDQKTDGSCSVRWENKTMYAIVTVFALHI